jgi:transmembrane sensor
MEDFRFDSERISRFFRRRDSDEDSSYINKVFSDRDKEVELKQLLKKHWYELVQEDGEEDKNFDHILHRIHYDINMNSVQNNNTPMRSAINWFSRVAAILLLPLSIYFATTIGKITKDENLAWVEIQAPAWTRAQFSLPDGTTGWLNSNSDIKYSVDFSNNRLVKLSGEAYFDVAKDAGRPFQVEADEIIVTVTGTRFNIASYKNEDVVEVVLEEGEVVCFNKAKNESCTLKPDDYLLFDKNKKEHKVELVQSDKYSSWKDGKLVFRNDPLDVIGRRLERWYNIEVEVRGEKTNNTGLWATFIDDNLEEVLKLLRLSLAIHYEVEYPQLQANGIYSKTKVIITN